MPPEAQSVKSASPSTKEKYGEERKDPPETDWWIRISTIATAIATVALAIIGTVAACLAKNTLRWLGTQTRANVRAANAAKESSDALANIERAWIDVRVQRTSGNYLYTVELRNYGRTVAHIREIVTELSFSPAQGNEAAFPVTTTDRKGKLLVPGSDPWPALLLNFDGGLRKETFDKVKAGEIGMSYHVTVHYSSIRPDCRSECLYYWNHVANYGCLVPVEAPEYNQHT